MKDLHGKTLLLTRSLDDSEQWAEIIEQQGGRALHLPCIRTVPREDKDTSQRLHEALADASWLMLTSRRGAEATSLLLPDPLPMRVRIAAVGSRTASASVRWLGRCDLESDGGGRRLAIALAKCIAEAGDLENARVVVAAADRAQRSLEEVLEPLGIQVTRIVVYRTIPAQECDPKLELSASEVHAILLASPSAAEGLRNIASIPKSLPIVTIGPSTTKAASSLGLKVYAEAKHPNLEGLLEVSP